MIKNEIKLVCIAQIVRLGNTSFQIESNGGRQLVSYWKWSRFEHLCHADIEACLPSLWEILACRGCRWKSSLVLMKGAWVLQSWRVFENLISRPIYGLIFLFKWDNSLPRDPCVQHEIPGLFFAKQVSSYIHDETFNPMMCLRHRLLQMLVPRKHCLPF